jgi:hypothetical protein
MKCDKCGKMISEEYEKDDSSDLIAEDDDASVKDSVLAELIEAMQGTVSKDLGKPAMVAVEIKKKG